MDPQGTLHTSLPSWASGPWHSPEVCPGALHSDQAEAVLVLSPDHQGTGGESMQPCIWPERGPHRRGAGSAPLRWPQDREPTSQAPLPPRPVSSWVSEVCAVGPFYR